MATTNTNRYKYLLATGGIVPGTTDIRMGLLKTLAAHTNVPDLNDVAAMEAHADFAEITGAVSGYARIALTGEAATEVDASDWALIDSDDVPFGSLGTGETIVGWFAFVEAASDALRELLMIGDVSPTVPTNGGPFSITTPSGLTKVV